MTTYEIEIMGGASGRAKMANSLCKPTMKSLRELAKVASDGGFDGPLEAIDYAEANANDTAGIADAAHYEQVAYDSIAWTSPFVEKLDVRLWFEAHGYAW